MKLKESHEPHPCPGRVSKESIWHLPWYLHAVSLSWWNITLHNIFNKTCLIFKVFSLLNILSVLKIFMLIEMLKQNCNYVIKNITSLLMRVCQYFFPTEVGNSHKIDEVILHFKVVILTWNQNQYFNMCTVYSNDTLIT